VRSSITKIWDLGKTELAHLSPSSPPKCNQQGNPTPCVLRSVYTLRALSLPRTGHYPRLNVQPFFPCHWPCGWHCDPLFPFGPILIVIVFRFRTQAASRSRNCNRTRHVSSLHYCNCRCVDGSIVSPCRSRYFESRLYYIRFESPPTLLLVTVTTLSTYVYPILPKPSSPTAVLFNEIGAGLRCACIDWKSRWVV
jgi:hypothetical protein